MPSGKRRFAMRPGGGLVVAGAGPYDRHDRDGFMPRAGVVGYFGRYAAAVLASARAGIQVLRVAYGCICFHRQPGEDRK